MKKSISTILALLAMGNMAMAESAAKIVREGNEAYSNEQYDVAKEKYDSIIDKEKLSTGHIDFNKANCLFKQGELDSAIELYRKAANNSTSKDLTAKSKFNLGNCYFQKAQASEQEKPQDAVKDYQQSARCYRQALDIDKTDTDAAQNIALTRKKIKELKEILQQQQEQQQQDNKDQDKQDQKGQENKDQDQNQQEQQNQDQQDKNQQNDQQQSQQDKQDQQQAGDKDKQDEKQQQEQQQADEKKKEEQQQQAQQSEEESDKEPEQIKQKAEVDPKAAQIIEDEKKRKEQKMQLIKIQQKPAKKDW